MAVQVRLLQTVPTLWVCPMCHAHKATHHPYGSVVTEMHTCPKMKNAWVPFQQDGAPRAYYELARREDYIRGDDVQVTADGDPGYMALVVHRDEGDDRFIYAPCARVNPEGR